MLCFQIPVQALVQFVEALEIGYSKYKNPYHNLIHAADVTQTAHFLMLHTGLMVTRQHYLQHRPPPHWHKDNDSPVCLCISIQHWLSELEILAMVFAAAIHDFEHTGTTNNFHIHTRYCRRERLMWPCCSGYMGHQSSLLVLYWCLLATWCPIKIFCRSNVLNYYATNLYPTLQTCFCIFSVILHYLDGTLVSQVRGGHSVQWQVGPGESSCERCLQTNGGGGHEHICQLEQGWLEVRKKYITHSLKLTAITQQMILTVSMELFGRELRTLVIEMVMSTDMSCHFQQIKTMKNALTQTDKSELRTKTLILYIPPHRPHSLNQTEQAISKNNCSHTRITVEMYNTWRLQAIP